MFHCSRTNGYCVQLADTTAMVFPSGVYEGPKLEGASKVVGLPTSEHVLIERGGGGPNIAGELLPPRTVGLMTMPSLSIQIPTLLTVPQAEEEGAVSRLEKTSLARVKAVLHSAWQLEKDAVREQARLEEDASQAEADLEAVVLSRQKKRETLHAWEDATLRKFVLLLGEKLKGPPKKEAEPASGSTEPADGRKRRAPVAKRAQKKAKQEPSSDLPFATPSSTSKLEATTPLAAASAATTPLASASATTTPLASAPGTPKNVTQETTGRASVRQSLSSMMDALLGDDSD